jgi:hypothetical protein
VQKFVVAALFIGWLGLEEDGGEEVEGLSLIVRRALGIPPEPKEAFFDRHELQKDIMVSFCAAFCSDSICACIKRYESLWPGNISFSCAAAAGGGTQLDAQVSARSLERLTPWLLELLRHTMERSANKGIFNESKKFPASFGRRIQARVRRQILSALHLQIMQPTIQYFKNREDAKREETNSLGPDYSGNSSCSSSEILLSVSNSSKPSSNPSASPACAARPAMRPDASACCLMKDENTLQTNVRTCSLHGQHDHLSGRCSSSDGGPCSTQAPSRITTTLSQYRTLVMLRVKRDDSKTATIVKRRRVRRAHRTDE